MSATPEMVDTAEALVAVSKRAARAPRVVLDLEANGRFAYRARLSTMQLAFDDEVVVIDPLAPGIAGRLEPLAWLLSRSGPVKVIHDVGYDARLLAEVGVALGNVHDTALTAQWLGRPATGLASLLAAELGVKVDKSLQAQDWAKRPLTDASVAYLANDVAHLLALDDRLWAEATDASILDELVEETAYRLAAAERAVREPEPRPAYTRAKGIEALSPSELAIFRRVYEAREHEAARLDTPSGELVPTGVLVVVARKGPSTSQELARIKSPIARLDPSAVALAILRAVDAGKADGRVPAEDRAWLEPPRMAQALVKARREREARLSAWRKAESVARRVNEQVVLPGHCAAQAVSENPKDREALARIGGFGAFRVARYGDSILAALAEPAPP